MSHDAKEQCTVEALPPRGSADSGLPCDNCVLYGEAQEDAIDGASAYQEAFDGHRAVGHAVCSGKYEGEQCDREVWLLDGGSFRSIGECILQKILSQRHGQHITNL